MEVYKPKDVQLFKLFEAFVKRGLEVLKTYVEAGGRIPIMTYYKPKVRFGEDGKSQGIEFVSYEEKDYKFISTNYYKQVMEVSALQDACRYVSDRKYLFIAGDNFAPSVLFYDALIDYLTKTNSVEYSEEESIDTYRKVESLIFNSEMIFRSTAKLENFGCAKDVVTFDDRHFIRMYTEEECKEIYRHPTVNIYDHTLPNPGDFRIEVVTITRKDNWREAGIDGREKIKQILTAMRVFKDSSVAISRLEVNEPMTWFPFTSSAQQLLPPASIGDSCSIGEDEVQNLIDCWETIKGISHDKIRSLEIAIKRFNYAHEHKDREDSLIDIMIGLESLFLKEIDELRFKLALRVATFLEASVAAYKGKKKEVFDGVYGAYKLRSKVVHGEKVPPAKIWECRSVKTYLAESIKQFARLSQNVGHNQIMHEIDECIKNDSKGNLLALFTPKVD
jgi:hypothetical protein